jgi:hypothetical protein
MWSRPENSFDALFSEVLHANSRLTFLGEVARRWGRLVGR